MKSILPLFFKRLFAVAFLLFVIMGAKAQVTLSLTSQEANSKTSVQSGDEYTVQLNYSFSSTAGSATGAKIVVNLPDDIYNVNDFIGSVHAPGTNFVFDNTEGAKKLTITFVDPLPSGSSGVLNFDVRTKNITTADNTVLTTTSTFTADGGYTSGPQTQSITVHASTKICAQKTLLNGGAIDNITTYRITLKYDGNSYGQAPAGTLGLTDLSITDVLPDGAEFVSGKLYNSNGTYIKDGTNDDGTVTFDVPDMNTPYLYGGTQWSYTNYYADIVVKYNSPTFKLDDAVTNNASVKYSVPLAITKDATLTDGQTVGICTSDLTETTKITPPSASANLWKSLSSSSNAYPGNVITYNWGYKNTGNVPLENVEIIEDIPSNLRLNNASGSLYNSIRIDAWSYLDHGEYQTNLGTGWVVLPSSTTNNFPITLKDGEYYTKLKFVLKTIPGNTALPPYNVLTFVPAHDVDKSETATNCLTWNSSTAGIPDETMRKSCAADVTLQPRPTTSAINYSSTSSPGCGAAPLKIGDVVTFSGSVSADGGYADAKDPVGAFLVPSGYKFVDGSNTFTAGTSGITATPSFKIISNYTTISGVTYDLYRFTFTSGTILPFGKNFSVSIKVATTAKLTFGSNVHAAFMATAGNSSIDSPSDIWAGNVSDLNDWDLDGNTTEKFRPQFSYYNSCGLSVAPSASVESIKWVKGQLDDEFSRYPDVATTIPGGVADYRLVVKNTGNVSMKGITLIDIFPHVGDVGVIDPSARGSEWAPNLAAPIQAPAGVTVYYSTLDNPCRDEIKPSGSTSPYPTGCTTANWSTTAPTDLTKVKSVKIDFGSTILTGGDSLVFSWPMRAPVDAPTNDETAYNSFAFTATRADNNTALLAAEPTKVGIKLKAGEPAFIGDRVWNDVDKDGIQDAAEKGLDGIVVKLMKPGTAGVRNPDADEVTAFTITANGGKYLFSNLPADDYYLVFVVPNDKLISPKNATGSYFDNDSDGEEVTYNKKTAAMTSIINVVESTEDLTWDLGLYMDPTGIPLPVRGLSLQITLQNNRSRIDWKVISESEVAYYEIERSTNGKDFSVIANSVAPKSNNDNAASYQAIDDVSNIANTNVLYYRIKVTYVTGRLDYSNIVSVKLGSAQKVTVWPNPVKNMVQLQMPSATITKAVVTLSDLTGRKLATYNYNLSKGNNQFAITDLDKYSSGIYILEVSYNDTKSVIKIKKE